MPTDNHSKKSSKYLLSPQCILHHALLITEVGMDLKERYLAGEKYICYLKSVLTGADKAISGLHYISKSSLEQAQQMLMAISEDETSSGFKQECEKLLTVIEKQLSDLEMRNMEENLDTSDMTQISEKIKYLETRQKHSENNLNPSTSSSKNLKTDEKYPENLSRESLIDINAVNLPTVPEDIFTSFSTNRPTRSSSLSSLKSMRKIKMYLQKAESSDDDDSSDAEDHDYTRLIYGDSDEGKLPSPHSPLPKKLLGNIKEETQD